MCTPLKLTGLPNLHFCFPYIIFLDVNLLKIILTSFFSLFFFGSRNIVSARTQQRTPHLKVPLLSSFIRYRGSVVYRAIA
jgi:hypothetical protein